MDQKKIIDAMNIIKPPFNINTAAQLAADCSFEMIKVLLKNQLDIILSGPTKLKKF